MNWIKSEEHYSMLNKAPAKIFIPARPHSTLNLCLEDRVNLGLGLLAPEQNNHMIIIIILV